MRTKTITLCLICFVQSFMALANQDSPQDTTTTTLDKILKKIDVSAYFQGQYQYGQKDVYKLAVGADNENYEQKSFNRIGLRRAFVSTMYQSGIVSALFTLEVRDRSIWFSDAYIQIDDPKKRGFLATIGSFNPFFGYEMSVSPSKYELAEGTWFLYNLLPDIYDIGAKLSYTAPPKYGSLNINLSLVGGNGVQQETDSRKDFVASAYASTYENKMFQLKGGISFYRGFVYQGTENVYTMDGSQFKLSSNPSNIGKYAKRQYFDVNAQLVFNSSIGKSELRGEYVWGTQPGSKFSNGSPNSSKRPEVDTYVRDFNGGYVYFLQQLTKKMPLTFLGGYNWYDPNTKVSGNDVGLNNTTSTDIKYDMAVMGLIWYPYPAIRVQAFYEMPFNEKSINLADVGYDKHRKGNVFTFRLQYKF